MDFLFFKESLSLDASNYLKIAIFATSAETGGLTHLERCGANFDVSLQAASRGGAVWLTHWAGEAGDPSLRLKNGFAQDDNRFETVKLNHYPAFTRVESCRALKL